VDAGDLVLAPHPIVIPVAAVLAAEGPVLPCDLALTESTAVLVAGFHPGRSPAGIVWTAITAVAMFALAAGKAETGAALDNPVLRAEGRVTLVDGLLASAVPVGLLLNALAKWWSADPLAGYVLVA
jgi:divalent metal cation (Fe/Co/Zn/Cd) transporter